MRMGNNFYCLLGLSASCVFPAFAQPISLSPMEPKPITVEHADYSYLVDGVKFHLLANASFKSSKSSYSITLPMLKGFFVGAPLIHYVGGNITIAYQGAYGGDGVGYVCRLSSVPRIKKTWCYSTLVVNMRAAIESDSIWITSWNSVERRDPKTGRLIWRNLDLSKTVGHDMRFGNVCITDGDEKTIYLQATAATGQSFGGLGITLDKATGRMLSNVSQGYNKFCSQ